MELKEKFINQCRSPEGLFGKIIAKRMNKGHSDMAKWGMSFISIKPDYYILDVVGV
ncbi:MAG: hypothetical protein ACFFC3_10515 [Candidatus Odinarchaeota archaeon]